MEKKSKSMVVETFPVWTDDTDIIWMIAEKRNLCCTFVDEPKGKSFVKVVGKPGKVCKFEKDLYGAKLVRTLGAFERFAEGLKRSSKDMARCLGNRGDMEILSIVAGKDEYFVTIGRREDRENEEDHDTAVSDGGGVCGEAPCAEENRVLVDQERSDTGEDGHLPGEDPGRPEGPGEDPGEAMVDLPADYPIDAGVLSGERARNAVAHVPAEVQEKGEWLTKAEYSARYDVSESTIDYWISKDILKVDKDAHPRTVFDGEKVPVREKRGKRFYWTWVDRDTLESANSQVNEAL